MLDISMCKGENCPIRDSCYRFTAIPDRFQSYGAFEEFLVDGQCPWYWEVKYGDETDSITTAEFI